MLAAYHISNALPGTKKLKEDMKQLKEAIEKCEEIGNAFEYFTANEWVFDNKQAMRAFRTMFTEAERRVFNIDVTRINWKMYIMNFAYGIKRFILKEEAELPSVGYNDVITVSGLSMSNLIPIANVQRSRRNVHTVVHQR